MEQKLNIAEILRNKPVGIKLYSPIFGDCTLCYIKDETNDICVKTQYDEIRFFNFEGLYNAGGECLLFPSKEMRDWSRFAWKRGDILADNDGETMVIFDKWYDDTYTSFCCRHYFNCEDKNHPVYYSEFLCTTVKYSFKNNQYANHDYLKAIEEKLGGKLNRGTLKIERQHKFKPFDKVLCRDYDRGKWGINFFSHYDESSDYPFVCIKGVYRQCIPYNDMTKHLLDTTGEWKGGE